MEPIIIDCDGYFNLFRTFNCGQAFRWKQKENGVWYCIAADKYIEVKEKDNKIYFYTDKQSFNKFWKKYFGLDTDYKEICALISKNDILKKTVEYGKGIRILKQDPWEALCSFIISQNNNIPRIIGIIERLCENFGTKTENGYTFPTAQRIAKLSLEDLSVLRSGFRAKYILDAAKKVASGEIDLNTTEAEQDIDVARNTLMQIYGVGKKVADCTMLFGMGKLEAFPEDVWIKRAVQVLFGGEFPKEVNAFAGVAQQFLFFYARETKLQI